MQLLFTCPRTQREFESDDYAIVQDQGVRTGPDGEKYWDAKVALNPACPFCGQKHRFAVSELSCPFSPASV